MRSFANRTVPIQGCYTALACLLVLGCGGHSGTATPAATGTSGTIGVPGASGTTAPPPGAAGNTTPVSTAGLGASAGGIGAAGGGTTATAGMVAPPTAGTGIAVAGTGAAGTPAPVGGTAAPPAPTGEVGAASVLQFHKHATRDGVYVDAAFTRTAAAMLKKDASFNAMTNGEIWAQPLYWDAGAGGTPPNALTIASPMLAIVSCGSLSMIQR